MYEEPHLSSSFCHVKLVTVEDLPENVTADEHEDNTDENGEEALENLRRTVMDHLHHTRQELIALE